MAEIIDLQKIIQEKKLQKVKEELNIELERLDYNMEKELNKYVIFDTSVYYELSKEDDVEVSKQNVMKYLLTAFDILIKLNEVCAANEVENLMTRLENNSYWGVNNEYSN